MLRLATGRRTSRSSTRSTRRSSNEHERAGRQPALSIELDSSCEAGRDSLDRGVGSGRERASHRLSERVAGNRHARPNEPSVRRRAAVYCASQPSDAALLAGWPGCCPNDDRSLRQIPDRARSGALSRLAHHGREHRPRARALRRTRRLRALQHCRLLDRHWHPLTAACQGGAWGPSDRVCVPRAFAAHTPKTAPLRGFQCAARDRPKGPYGIRTRAAAVRGRCPRPLDEWAP